VITWMTRMSVTATAADLGTFDLAVQVESANAILRHLLYEEENEQLDPKSPALWMWEGYEIALAAYVAAMATELTRRGISATTYALRVAETVRELRTLGPLAYAPPPWWEDTDVLRSHRSNLLRRNKIEYEGVWGNTPDNIPYLWVQFEDDPEGSYILRISKYDKDLISRGLRKLPKTKARII
jgi:hypothetical protein